MNAPPTLCLMLKAPRPGAVKTRLAASIGPDAATRVYRALVERQAAEIPRDWSVEVHFAPGDAEEEMRRWLAALLPARSTFFPQPQGDLGARLNAALTGATARGARPVLFAGGDCPQLTTRRLHEAATALRTVQSVIIPATDGGYVLIGFSGPGSFAFDGIAWSTSAVFAQTRNAVRTRGMTLQTFPPLEDVDDLPSLLRACEHCPPLRGFGCSTSAPLPRRSTDEVAD